MTTITYKEPITGTIYNSLPKLWHNTAGLKPSNCELLGWEIITTVTEDPIIEEPVEENPIVQLDRDKLKIWLADNGKSGILTNWNELPLELAEWWFLKCDYLAGSTLALYLQNLLQLTDEEMVDLVSVCGPQTEEVEPMDDFELTEETSSSEIESSETSSSDISSSETGSSETGSSKTE